MGRLGKLAAAIALTSSAASANAVVIYEIYGGGGNTGAPYTNDFVVLFNEDSSAVSLAGWSLQYASASGTGNFGLNSAQLTPLSGTLQPGEYFLVQEASNAAVGSPLPTPDITDGSPINMSATAGKVAIVRSTTGLGCNGGSTPCSAAQLALIEDLVGYGSANFFEGTGAAPTISNTLADFRANGGCTDTNNNSADFSAGAPSPRNSSSAYNVCSSNGTAPEPATLALVGLGLAGLGALRRRRH